MVHIGRVGSTEGTPRWRMGLLNVKYVSLGQVTVRATLQLASLSVIVEHFTFIISRSQVDATCVTVATE